MSYIAPSFFRPEHNDNEKDDVCIIERGSESPIPNGSLPVDPHFQKPTLSSEPKPAAKLPSHAATLAEIDHEPHPSELTHVLSSPSPSPSFAPLPSTSSDVPQAAAAAAGLTTPSLTETTNSPAVSLTNAEQNRSHRPRLVRKPSPIENTFDSGQLNAFPQWQQSLERQRHSELNDEQQKSMQPPHRPQTIDGSARDHSLELGDAKNESSAVSAINSARGINSATSNSATMISVHNDPAPDAAVGAAAATAAVAAVKPNPPTNHQTPITRTSSLFDDASMDVDFESFDLEAVLAKAASTNATPKSNSLDGNTVDTNNEHTPVQTITAPATSEYGSNNIGDIEDLVTDHPPAIPLALRPAPPLFFVTDFSALNWCEKQVDLVWRLGKRAPPPKAQAIMDAGVAIHLAYELETVEKVEIEVETNEDIWALRLLNMVLGIQELQRTGRTRELPIFGCYELPATPPSHVSTGKEGKAYTVPRFVWIMGIIDEVVRNDLFDAEMKRKFDAKCEIEAKEKLEQIEQEKDKQKVENDEITNTNSNSSPKQTPAPPAPTPFITNSVKSSPMPVDNKKAPSPLIRSSSTVEASSSTPITSYFHPSPAHNNSKVRSHAQMSEHAEIPLVNGASVLPSDLTRNHSAPILGVEAHVAKHKRAKLEDELSDLFANDTTPPIIRQSPMAASALKSTSSNRTVDMDVVPSSVIKAVSSSSSQQQLPPASPVRTKTETPPTSSPSKSHFPKTIPLVSTHSSSSSQTLIDMDIDDEDMWVMLSQEKQKQEKLEELQQINQQQQEKQQQQNQSQPVPPKLSPVPQIESIKPVVPSALKNETPAKPTAHHSALPPIQPSATLQRTSSTANDATKLIPPYVVMDHKTRFANNTPALTQKIGTYLQISVYKFLLDRWLGKFTTEQQQQQSLGDSTGGFGGSSSLASDQTPPFDLEQFFTAFRLHSSKPFSSVVQKHLAECGLPSSTTLGELLLLCLHNFQSMPATGADMKVEYEWQKDGRFIGHDSYKFDRRWLLEELDHHMKYWMGQRAPNPVSLSDGFKCSRCEYADSCDDRVERYKRVGRLIVPKPDPSEVELEEKVLEEEKQNPSMVVGTELHPDTNSHNGTSDKKIATKLDLKPREVINLVD